MAKRRKKSISKKQMLMTVLAAVLVIGSYYYRAFQPEEYPAEEYPPYGTEEPYRPTEEKPADPETVPEQEGETDAPDEAFVFSYWDVPEYSGEPFVILNDHNPTFTEEELARAAEEAYETYSDLDELGRCGVVEACVGKELMPTEPRGSISSVKPTGWKQEFYDFVDGEALYNRCHLLGFQLTGENANKRNLITGTRYLNVKGMLPYEDLIADYVYDTGNHVLYRVTPIFVGEELLARGVWMEGWSVEDGGKDVRFNVFCYNVQPGVELDYATGENWLAEEAAA